MFSRFLMLGVNHRITTLLLLGLVTALAGTGLPRLTVDTGFSSLISDTDPNKLAYDRVAREFGSDNRTLIYIRDDQLWTPQRLRDLERLHTALESLPFVHQVDDLFTLRSIRGRQGELESRLLLSEAPKHQAGADAARANALANPLLLGNVVSADGKVIAISVAVRELGHDPDFDRRVYGELERTLELVRPNFERVFQIGPPRINAELKSSLFEDLLFLGPLSASVLVVAILFFLRSGFAAFVPLLTSGLSIVWTFGLMGWLGLPLNMLSAMLPSLVIAIGSTEDTHMMSSYFSGLAGADADRRAYATRFMLKHVGVPMMLTIFTTSMGFASNAFGDIGLIREFAIAATFAILANGLITVMLVPALLSWLGPTHNALHQNDDHLGGLPGLLVRVFGFTKQRLSRATLLLTGLLCVFFVYQASHLYVTNDPMSYFRADRPLIQDTNRVQADLSGMKVFYINLASEQDKAFQEPRNLRKLQEIQDFLDEQGIFDRSLSLADHLALVNREFHNGNPNYHVLPRSRELVAQYLLFFHRRDITSYVSHDYRRANIVVRHNISDSRTLNRHIAELREVVPHLAGEGMRAYVVGENLMVNAAAETLMEGQLRSLGILLLVIFLTMSAMFTSIKGGLISLVPSLIPIILMFGIMGSLDIPLNPGTAMVAVIAIGIAIDGTIHLFSRYNELCRRTSDYEEAVQITVREEATPVVATSLALALGFGILVMSNFTLVAQFGALSAATMLFSIFANLLITPLIMSRIRLVGLHQILAMKMQKEILEASPLFQDMSDYQTRKAILISEMNEFQEGDLLVKQGEVGRSMYLILSGRVAVSICLDNEEMPLAELEPGQFFGEIGFTRETERTANVRAITPVEALRFDYERMNKDLRFFPHIVAKLNANISRVLGERLADVTTELAESREKLAQEK